MRGPAVAVEPRGAVPNVGCAAALGLSEPLVGPRLHAGRDRLLRALAVNCTNDREVYSFHPGGANVVLADGSVRFLAAIDIRVFARLVTRAGGEVVSGSDF